MKIIPSTRADKRLMAQFKDGSVVHFGQPGASTYVDRASASAKRSYLARHKPRGDWTNPKTAGSLSRWILWGDSRSLTTNIREFKHRFNLL